MQYEQSLPEQQRLQRVVVIGCCGAGKSTFSSELAHCLGVPHVERDLLGELGSDAYRNAVAAIVHSEGWVFDGPPYFVDALVYPSAQTIIWLDYSRPLVVCRAIHRALRRTFASSPLDENNRERLRQWVAPGGPCFAHAVYAERKREFRQLQQRPELSGKMLRFGSPALARAWLALLEATGDEEREV